MDKTKSDSLHFDDMVRHIKSVIPNSEEVFKELKYLNWEKFPLRRGKNSQRSLCCPGVENTEVGRKMILWMKEWFILRGVKCEVVGIFGNFYPDGAASLPRHQDKYGYDIVSLSFGESRRFHFAKSYKGSIIKPSFELSDGDMFIFKKEMNDSYYHGINSQNKTKGLRINLTCFVTFQGDPYKILNDEKLATAMQFAAYN